MSYAGIVMAFASAAVSTDTPPAQVDPLDKVKCVRESVIGSLVTSRRVCCSLRKCNRINDAAQEEARRITQPRTPYQPN